MLVFFALGNTKVLSFALADAKVPNASSFAFWLNVGFSVQNQWIEKISSLHLRIDNSHQGRYSSGCGYP